MRLSKERKKEDKIVSDSQERAYWRVARPPPGSVSALEPCPVPVRARTHRHPTRTNQHLNREVSAQNLEQITNPFGMSYSPCEPRVANDIKTGNYRLVKSSELHKYFSVNC